MLASFSTGQIIRIVISVVLVMFSAILHEVAHGWAAYRLGDPTAKEAGRLTLNPAAHLDGFGSIVLPLLMGLMGGPIFAYAKPVPYNPNRLRKPRRDEVLVALAGPTANLLQALLGTALLYVFYHGYVGLVQSGVVISTDVIGWIVLILESYVYVNLVLMTSRGCGVASSLRMAWPRLPERSSWTMPTRSSRWSHPEVSGERAAGSPTPWSGSPSTRAGSTRSRR